MNSTTCVTAPVTSTAATRFWHPALVALLLMAVGSSACSREPTKDELLVRANEAFAADQYANAEKQYREVLRIAPGDPVAQRQLGIIYNDQGQVIQAYPLLRKSAELQPDDAEVQLKLALTLFAFREFAQARDAAALVLKNEPGNEQALLLLADAAVAPSDLEETRKLVESLRAADKDRPGYHLALGALDARRKETSRAESEFKAALDMDPKSASAHATLGMLYWSRNELGPANEEFRTAMELTPPRSPFQVRYAEFKVRTGAVAEAKDFLEALSHKVPDHLPPRVLLVRIACEKKEDDCAARVQNVLAQDPTNFDAVYHDGVISLSKGDLAKAIREFEYLSNTYKGNAQVRYQLALAYLQQAKTANAADSRNAIDNAESRLNEAIQLNPRFEQAVLLFAELKIRKGSAASAIDPLERLTKEQPQISQAQYLLATAYLAQRRTDQALAVYRHMTELFPKDPQPSFLIGTILLAERQQPEARKAFEESARVSPDYLPAVERLVDFDLADQQYATAMDRVQAQIDKDPKRAQPWALRAKIYLAQRDPTRAEPDLLKAIELEPNFEAAYMLLAQLYVASNREQQAVEKLNAFADKTKTVPTLMLLGSIHERLKDFPAARDAYEKLLTVSANFAPALNNLAVLYSERLGQLDKAYDLAKQAREAAPNDPNVADTLGWISFKKGDYGSALRLLRESASKISDQPEIQFHLGMAHYMMGEEEPARVALQRATDANADFPGKDEARARLALLAIDIGAPQTAARNQLESYLRERPNDPVALVHLARLQERDGAVDQAVKTYEQVVANYPLFAPATRQLALLYGRGSSDVAKAYELALKARQAYPEDPEITKTLGILSYRREFYPRSVELLKEASAKLKEDSETLYYLGEAHRQLKQLKECKEALERALELKLAPPLVEDAKRTLLDCSEAPTP